jgi:cobaltochelatase CobN
MQIAENTLSHYKALHGEYPDSTAVILWGFETTKTRGETVGQILGYLGVRVVHNSNPYHKKIAPIPLPELGRPRIDCVVQICGFFRDMYPNVMDLLNRSFQLVSELPENEAENHVRRNTLSLKTALAGQVADHLLDRISAGRIFGPRAGEYGTRTTQLIETGAWKTEEEISDLFTGSMSHLYADNIHGERHLEVFRRRLSAVDVVSQVRDSHEYEIVDLDHYIEEAEFLADRVAFIDNGCIVETDSPSGFITRMGGWALDCFTEDDMKTHYFKDRKQAHAFIAGHQEGFTLRRVNLEDAFLALTGKKVI